MKMKNIIMIIIGVLISFGFYVHSVSAFSISPPIVDIKLDPNETYKNNLTLYDEDLKGATIKLEAKSFVVNPETGQFDRLTDPQNKENEWVKLEKDVVELPGSGESVEVPFSITPPPGR